MTNQANNGKSREQLPRAAPSNGNHPNNDNMSDDADCVSPEKSKPDATAEEEKKKRRKRKDWINMYYTKLWKQQGLIL
jgi:hypothetical protein